jgi:hypothetical protein
MGERHTFLFPIGDWSNDGHGQCDTFPISAAKDSRSILAAIRAMAKKHPDLSPYEICSDYEQPTITRDQFERIRDLGFPEFSAVNFEDPEDYRDQDVYMDVDLMIE